MYGDSIGTLRVEVVRGNDIPTKIWGRYGQLNGTDWKQAEIDIEKGEETFIFVSIYHS